MKVVKFDKKAGIYISQFGYFTTDFHSHPPIEIIYAKKGLFSVSDHEKEYHNLQFAIIDSNKKHKLIASDSEVTIVMIEHHGGVNQLLSNNNIILSEGFYYQEKDTYIDYTFDRILEELEENLAPPNYDSRVLEAIKFMDNHDVSYFAMLQNLMDLVSLSESRLSHLFKENVGISLKKYFVWSKLKKAVEEHLATQEDLFSVLIKNGFYDQPHFSNAFKNMLGIAPSKVYNSRILQVLNKIK